jgi:hypothetical protein
MEPQTLMQEIPPRSHLALYISSGLALLIIGFILAVFIDPYLPASLSNTKKGYQAGFTAARTLVENSSLGNFFKTPAMVNSLQGTVTAINGNELTLHLNNTNPFDDPTLTNRTVLLSASTTVIRLTVSAPSQTTVTKSAIPQMPTFVQTPAAPSDIAVGEAIDVSAAGNIVTLSIVPAQSIVIQTSSKSSAR